MSNKTVHGTYQIPNGPEWICISWQPEFLQADIAELQAALPIEFCIVFRVIGWNKDENNAEWPIYSTDTQLKRPYAWNIYKYGYFPHNTQLPACGLGVNPADYEEMMLLKVQEELGREIQESMISDLRKKTEVQILQEPA